MLQFDFVSTSNGMASKWIPQYTFYDKSILVQVLIQPLPQTTNKVT